MRSPASEKKPIRVLVVDDTRDSLAPLIKETLAKSECIAVLSCDDIKEEEPSMLETMMIYARGLSEWPMDIFKNVGNNTYRGKGRKGKATTRNKKQNMNRVGRATKRKHKRAR